MGHKRQIMCQRNSCDHDVVQLNSFTVPLELVANVGTFIGRLVVERQGCNRLEKCMHLFKITLPLNRTKSTKNQFFAHGRTHKNLIARQPVNPA